MNFFSSFTSGSVRGASTSAGSSAIVFVRNAQLDGSTKISSVKSYLVEAPKGIYTTARCTQNYEVFDLESHVERLLRGVSVSPTENPNIGIYAKSPVQLLANIGECRDWITTQIVASMRVGASEIVSKGVDVRLTVLLARKPNEMNNEVDFERESALIKEKEIETKVSKSTLADADRSEQQAEGNERESQNKTSTSRGGRDLRIFREIFYDYFVLTCLAEQLPSSGHMLEKPPAPVEQDVVVGQAKEPGRDTMARHTEQIKPPAANNKEQPAFRYSEGVSVVARRFFGGRSNPELKDSQFVADREIFEKTKGSCNETLLVDDLGEQEQQSSAPVGGEDEKNSTEKAEEVDVGSSSSKNILAERLKNKFLSFPFSSGSTRTSSSASTTSYRYPISEGCSSNFFVLYKNGTVRTAPDKMVLAGTVRKLVCDTLSGQNKKADESAGVNMLLCLLVIVEKYCGSVDQKIKDNITAESLGLDLVLVPPSLDEIDEWEAAFVTSTSRLVLPIDTLVLPTREFSIGGDGKIITKMNVDGPDGNKIVNNKSKSSQDIDAVDPKAGDIEGKQKTYRFESSQNPKIRKIMNAVMTRILSRSTCIAAKEELEEIKVVNNE